MGNLKVEIDYGSVACALIATRNAANNLIKQCDKIEASLDEAVKDIKIMSTIRALSNNGAGLHKS